MAARRPGGAWRRLWLIRLPRLSGSHDVPGVAILTTTPNELVERIHNRMPVILDAAGVDLWLSPSASVDDVMSATAPIASDSLRMWPVSTAINDVRTDGPHLLAPFTPPVALGLT